MLTSEYGVGVKFDYAKVFGPWYRASPEISTPMKTLTLGLTFTLLTALTACVGDAGSKDDVEDSTTAGDDDSGATGDDDSGGGGDDSTTTDDSEAPDNDKDNDGYDADEDCDDGDRAVNPGATESCDGVDNDCDGDVDDADASVTGQSECFVDADADGYGAGAAVGEACQCPEGQASQGEDCDDNDFYRSPGQVEECDGGIDNDCDELVDADDPSLAEGNTYYLDKDGDKYGDDSTGLRSCSRVAGRITTGGDCDDADKTINPGVEEVCDDEIDNDCTDGVDDGCGGDTGTGGEIETWTGEEGFLYAFTTKKDTFECDMHWDTVGVLSSVACPDCDYAFDVDFYYDESKSVASSRCSGLAGDLTLTFGFDSDYYYDSYGPFSVMLYYSASYAEWGYFNYANFDASTGLLLNYSYFKNYPYTYKGKKYYYTNYWYGYAYLK